MSETDRKDDLRCFVEQIEESLQDELSDVEFYANIANESPDDISRKIITSIVGDESAHARTQAALLHQLNPDAKGAPPVQPPANTGYVEDIRMAIVGETHAVARYAHLASIAPTREIRYLLMTIMGDEFGHIRIWLALLENIL
ncbi:ferritin family protein [Sulfobacillus harzensis]|uniref:Ferritin-like domain-containing protein n=1 Tax=Sulfobacillus harzensis TaxID=2729629 RepID=A0A7Y0L441_9FIRM|nr:ferritin-like domain-containing protein [Sulfobacillus harzensis]NMP22941.1 ferritin-like domain-containing protein [Sulfobacillus harzensis]